MGRLWRCLGVVCLVSGLVGVLGGAGGMAPPATVSWSSLMGMEPEVAASYIIEIAVRSIVQEYGVIYRTSTGDEAGRRAFEDRLREGLSGEVSACLLDKDLMRGVAESRVSGRDVTVQSQMFEMFYQRVYGRLRRVAEAFWQGEAEVAYKASSERE